VVVTGLQRVRPGIKVKATMVAPAATADTRSTLQAK
jgi:hypothetical protein